MAQRQLSLRHLSHRWRSVRHNNEQQANEAGDLVVPSDGDRRPRILALCGAKSNNVVTRLQLENLHITDEHYNVHFLHGNIEEEEGHEKLMGLFHGPFYSWIDTSDEKAMNESVVNAVRLVLKAVKVHGPFDGVYGFSNGGLIAALAANVFADHKLRQAVEASPVSTHQHIRVPLLADKDVVLNLRTRQMSTRRLLLSSSRTSNPHQFDALTGAFARHLEEEAVSNPVVINGDPFGFVVCACAGMAMEGVRSITCSVLGCTKDTQAEEDGRGHSVNVKSLHLIGIEDPLKTRSEEVASLFVGGKVMYLSGGHAVGRDERYDVEMISILKEIAVPREDSDSPNYEPKLSSASFKEINPVSYIAVNKDVQVTHVRLRNDLLPSGKHGATIVDCLKAQPREKPFLFNARDPGGVPTTYGQALDFIEGGEGDLRRLGVKAGDVVAYGAPSASGVAAALAFLCVGAQTTAAPLAPGMTKPDVLDALDQFHTKHLILFEDVDAPGIKDAFVQYSANGKGQLHTARIFGPDKPGQFEFTSEQATDWNLTPKLSNPEKGHCLLLRTSGTTARPKGVPLAHGALVNNGAIIAASMQLTSHDVCYSVMPLFHIGGISASILCSLASGGSVCCDNESFDPERMVDALALSNPQPTWYSSVPTIHNATVAFLKEQTNDKPKYAKYGIKGGLWEKGHSLRMIRSGAAALLPSDAVTLSTTYGGLPIYSTYSMSEQMPISQPPVGKIDTVIDKPGSVGVPVATSLAIVSRSHLRPQPYGQEGEIAISGDNIMRKYLENPEADAKSYFYLTLPSDPVDVTPDKRRYFLTGDVGVIDREGFLSLKGRAKELIKKGGEQVSPYEVEAELLDHPWVRIPVCFSVPSKVYGEEVGCAIVLNDDAPNDVQDDEVIKSLRKWMKQKKFTHVKWPTKWWIGLDEELPKTATKKYIRVGLADKLGFDYEEEEEGVNEIKETKANIDWGVITGFRFFLACYVMFMHIGSNESWGHFNNLRGWPWHVHCFYTLGGFSMASPMNPEIKKKFSYFLARIKHMYLMYAVALVLGLANLLIVCRPSTFDTNFHWDGQPDDIERGFFCEGTPATKTSWWASLVTTIVTYVFGLAITPIWPLNWWMGYYLWFSSMYYQCLAVFPAAYNYLFLKARKNRQLLIKIMIVLQVLNAVILIAAWFSMNGAPSYNHYDDETGEKNDPSEYNNAYGSEPVVYNAVILSFYLFAPFWNLYFIIGVVLAFIYDAYKPSEHHNAYIWGYVTDACTLIQLGITITIIVQPKYDDPDAERWFRPEDANYIGDASYVHRLWDNLCGRIMCPLTTLWIFGMATGEGYTSMIFRNDFLVNTLGPNSYNCFLFHQMVGQWYSAATRPGMWNWWQHRKSFYWFSPGPCPVEWYEYFTVVGLVVAFASFMNNTIGPYIMGVGMKITRLLGGEKDDNDDVDIGPALCDLIEKMTGIEPEMDSTLDEVGMASVGIPVLVGMLNSALSTKGSPLSVTLADLVEVKTIGDIVLVVEEARDRMQQDGV